MKTIAAILALLMLVGPALALSDLLESPNTLKIDLIDPYGKATVLVAWQNTTTGIWMVACAGDYYPTMRLVVGNETGHVKIT